jgi:hypothetical protein
MRLLGLLLLALGGAGTVAGMTRLFHERRPRDLVWAIVTPVSLTLALLGALLLFVPEFLG